jgi:cytochrome c2
MRTNALLITTAAFIGAVPLSAAIQADARQGADFFVKQGCNNCHSVGEAVRAKAPGAAPNLAAPMDRDYTPSGIASRMWNHAPAMWSAMGKAGMERPNVTEQDAANLFAFFYSARYFERPGDAGRGKRLFTEKKCADCHSGSGPGPKVADWDGVRDPVALVSSMWNHAGKMKAEFAQRKIAWPQLTAQELTDLLVYLRNVPGARTGGSSFEMRLGGGAGDQLFKEKGCADCHKGANALENKIGHQTLTEIAAEMWNHAPLMKQSSPVSESEMRQILASVWANSFFASRGNPARGKRVFDAKKCGACHGEGNAPKLAGLHTSAVSMVSALWKHGPNMLEQLKQKNMAWPQFTPNQMSDLVAYLAEPANK